MPDSHVIRLRGPWEFRPLARFDSPATQQPGGQETPGRSPAEARPLPDGGRSHNPGGWRDLLGSDFLGQVRCARRFNCPTNLDLRDRVWLAFEGLENEAVVSVNGHPLGKLSPTEPRHRFDITDILRARNLLEVEISKVLHPRDNRSAPDDQLGMASETSTHPRIDRANSLFGEVTLEIVRDDLPPDDETPDGFDAASAV
jgi:hypothetical protein